MAIGQETEGRGIGGFMKRSQDYWDKVHAADLQDELRRQREAQAEAAKKAESGGEKEEKKDDRPASQRGLNTSSSSIGSIGAGGAVMPYERREGAGVGGSTGQVTHYDAGKAPPYLDAIADKYGINRDDFKRMAFVESGFDTRAHNPSGASGLFQFMPKTAGEFGLRNVYDGPSNADAAARLWNSNKEYLTKALGREPTGGELYLAHQQGAGGAAKMLANPNAPAASFVGRSAITQNGGSANMTAGEFAHKWTSKFDGTRVQSADGATPRNRDAGNSQSPVRVADSGAIQNDASPSRLTPAAATASGARFSNGGSTYADSLKNSATPATQAAVTTTAASSRPHVLSNQEINDAVGRGQQIVYDGRGRAVGSQPYAAGKADINDPSAPARAGDIADAKSTTAPTTAATPATTTPSTTTTATPPAAPPSNQPAAATAATPQPGGAWQNGMPQPGDQNWHAPMAAPQTGQSGAPQTPQQGDGGGFLKDIGSFFSGEPIRDANGREWDALYGFEKPPAEATAGATASAAASEGKSILDFGSVGDDIGGGLSDAFNWFSSIFQ